MALSDGLYAYYSLEEASGDAIDAFGTIDFSEATAGKVGSSTGKVGNCRTFDNTSGSCLSGVSGSFFNFGDTDFTIALWVYGDAGSLSTTRYVLAKYGASGSRCYNITTDNSGVIRFVGVSDGSSQVVRSWTSSLSTETWYYVVAWHDTTAGRIYLQVDNASPVSSVISAIHSATGTPLRIGAPSNGSSSWIGRLDEIGFWTRVLTSDERTELYNSGNGRDYAYISGGGGGGAIPVFRHHYRQMKL